METDDILVAITQTPQAYSSLQREKSSTVDRVHPSTVQLFKQQQQQQFILVFLFEYMVLPKNTILNIAKTM